MPEDLLQVESLSKSFRSRGRLFGRPVRAVSEVSLALQRGQTLGLVGESGCGKSTLARLILHLVEPDAGSVRIGGAEFTHAPTTEQRRLRRRLQIVFQDALSSLNPRMTVGVNIAEPMRLQGLGSPAERRDAARELLHLVGLRIQDEERYPHEFSGGQCQRIAIARALILRPDVVVFDEAVSALDVSIRAQILRLIMDLQQRLGLSYIFISHDLGVVKRVADRIAVMYLGRIVEIGPADAVARAPLHPYAEALLRAIPIADPRRMRVRDLGLTEGEAASPVNPPAGCAFHQRCARRLERCEHELPPFAAVGPGRSAACFLHMPRAPQQH
jgi:peptide/nickel transport system ATP-binding protein/oligopeptide transport system ATP-binding protein